MRHISFYCRINNFVGNDEHPACSGTCDGHGQGTPCDRACECSCHIELRETVYATKNACPVCGAQNDAATSADLKKPDAVPKAGDITICAYCAEILAFVDDNGGVRTLTSAEVAEAMSDPTIRNAVRAVHALIRSGRLR